MEILQAIGTVSSVFFSLGTTPATSNPKFDCATAVINLFNEAKKTVNVAIYSLTKPDIVNAMIAENNRGIKATVVTDETESKNANMTAMIKNLTQTGFDRIQGAHREFAIN